VCCYLVVGGATRHAKSRAFSAKRKREPPENSDIGLSMLPSLLLCVWTFLVLYTICYLRPHFFATTTRLIVVNPYSRSALIAYCRQRSFPITADLKPARGFLNSIAVVLLYTIFELLSRILSSKRNDTLIINISSLLCSLSWTTPRISLGMLIIITLKECRVSETQTDMFLY